MDWEHHRTLKRYNPAADPAASPQPPFFDLPSASSQAPHGNDDHYNHYHNHQHPPQRRRMESPWRQQPAQRHYPRDGFDFRMPVMSAQETNNMDWTHHEQNTIDLTEDRHDHSLPHMRIALPPIPGERPADAPGSSSRTQRGPRFERNIINLDNSDEEDHTHRQMHHHTHDNPLPGQSTAQDEESLFIPDTASAYPPYAGVGAQRRPTTSGLRPGYMRNYPTAAERDEIQVVASRSLSRHPSRRSTPSLPRPYEAANNTGSATIDLTADDDDDVIHTSTRALPGINGDLPAMAGSGIGTRERPAFGIAHLAQMMRARGGSPGVFDRFGGLDAANTDDERARTLAHQRRAMEHFEQRRQHRLDLERQVGERNAQQAQDTIAQLRATGAAGRRYRHQQLRQAAMGVGLPAARNPLLIDLDFGAAAFDMGLGEPARPATPKYEAPPPPEKGFTRSPEEDEEVVCPNCGDELGVSKDETKAQVWVVKGCGHAYCGECATRKALPASKKGKGRAADPSIPPVIKKCVVVGCEKSVNKQWIHVYMSN